MKARSSRGSRASSRKYQKILDLGLLKLVGTDDGHEYSIQFESGNEKGQTPFQLSQGGEAVFEHFVHLRAFDERFSLIQVQQRTPGRSDTMPVFNSWISVDWPHESASRKTYKVRLANGLQLLWRVMFDMGAISERSYVTSSRSSTYSSTSSATPSLQSFAPPLPAAPSEDLQDLESQATTSVAPSVRSVAPQRTCDAGDMSKFESEVLGSEENVLRLLKLFIGMFGGMMTDDGPDRKDELNVNDFRSWIEAFDPKITGPNIEGYFNAIDADGSGFLTRLEIIQYLHSAVVKNSKKKRGAVRKVESCLCFMMFASQPADMLVEDKDAGPVLTTEDLNFMLENMMSCTMYRQKSTLQQMSRNIASEMLNKYSVKHYEDRQHVEHKYLRQEDFDKIVEDPEYAQLLDMWRHLSNFGELKDKAKDRNCAAGCNSCAIL